MLKPVHQLIHIRPLFLSVYFPTGLLTVSSIHRLIRVFLSASIGDVSCLISLCANISGLPRAIRGERLCVLLNASLQSFHLSPEEAVEWQCSSECSCCVSVGECPADHGHQLEGHQVQSRGEKRESGGFIIRREPTMLFPSHLPVDPLRPRTHLHPRGCG